ncbi:MAG TPA: tail fiber domain-containing protein, partial [Ferruginibacter sp.]|nr:tail fiber domain-containing protein [Ferruginibacter sp.]
NTSATYNSANGAMAMYYNTSGSYNTAIGALALHRNVSGSNNTVIGQAAGLGTAGNSFSNNTIVGYQSGYSLTTGSNNVFIGYQSGYNETAGSNKLYIANSSSNPPLVYGDFSAGRIGLGTIAPGEKLEVNGNIQLTSGGTVQAAPSSVGSAYSITVRGGDPYVPVGGSGGSVNIVATNNMPAGGSGYSNLGTSGAINLTAGSGYNSGGGHINITAGATSCWALASNSHSDVNIQGGQNLVAADAASINVQGGGTVGVGCPTPNANGGNLILKSGIGTGSGTQGNIQLLNGNVGIGTSAPSSKLEVCGNTRIIGTLNVSSTLSSSTGITCPSDIRYKKDISPIADPLQKLLKLNGVNYYWKQEEFINMNFSDKMQTGFIAQDLEKIFPEMVFTDEKGYKSVDYSRLTPVLVETIKEQQKQIKAINKKLEEIERSMRR